MSKIEEMLSLFLTIRKAAGFAPRTLRDYRTHIEALCSHLSPETEDYRTAALAYLGEDIGPNTYNIRFKVLKVFFDWCLSEELLSCGHPLAGLKKRRAVGRIVHIENDRLEALLALPDRSTFAGLRDYSLMLFSLDCGARPGESLQLTERDFNFSALLVTIPAPVAKTRLPRTIPITPQTALVVRSLLAAHSPLWKDAPVFCSEEGTLYAVNSWGHRLRGYSARLGTPITPYHLRHAAALGMLRAGMSAFALRDMLGHADISMTQKYLALTLDDLRREHAGANLVDTIAPRRVRVRKV